jgi:hypothetical protein
MAVFQAKSIQLTADRSTPHPMERNCFMLQSEQRSLAQTSSRGSVLYILADRPVCDSTIG